MSDNTSFNLPSECLPNLKTINKKLLTDHQLKQDRNYNGVCDGANITSTLLPQRTDIKSNQMLLIEKL